MSTTGDPPDLAVSIAMALEQRRVSYAIGGALAYAFWGIPRATMDVDINVFVELDEVGPVFAALSDVGIAVEPLSARAAITSRGMFEAMLGPVRVDVFLPSIPFSREAERTRKRQLLEGQSSCALERAALSGPARSCCTSSDIFAPAAPRPRQTARLEEGGSILSQSSEQQRATTAA